MQKVLLSNTLREAGGFSSVWDNTTKLKSTISNSVRIGPIFSSWIFLYSCMYLLTQ